MVDADKIELIVFDIDGVITDGSLIIDSEGKEQKRINLKDVDAIFELSKRGYKLAAITGEDTDIVNYFEKRFPWEFFYRGSKTKKDAMLLIESETGISRDHICYVGDGKYDVEPLLFAKLGVCPSNAIDSAKTASDVILQNEGGKGCIWELISIIEDYNKPFSGSNYFLKRLKEHTEIFKKMATDKAITDSIIDVANLIIETLNAKGAIFFFGNGGSAADAQHIATEFISRFYYERPGLHAEALSVNPSTITAVGNDYGFERVFSRQLEAKAQPGDIAIGISTSGRSKNVIEALRYANENGIRTVLLTGDNPLHEVNNCVEFVINAPSSITPRIQETHTFIGHVIAEYVEWRMFGQNDKSI